MSLEHEELVVKLVSHKVSEEKAREMVAAKPEAVSLHLRAIPYLPEGQGKRNFAGRLVKAIENDYELPQAFIEALEKQGQDAGTKNQNSKVQGCPYCGELSGWRYVKGHNGPVRRCTHTRSKRNIPEKRTRSRLLIFVQRI